MAFKTQGFEQQGDDIRRIAIVIDHKNGLRWRSRFYRFNGGSRAWQVQRTLPSLAMPEL